MSDDICGHETNDGTPCEHPAGENGRCHIPQHNPDDTESAEHDSPGRPSSFTYLRAHRAIDAAEDGLSKAGCARAAGVGEATLQRWIEGDKWLGETHFRRAFMRARAQGERRLATGALYDPPEDEARERRTINGQHARFLLSTSFDYVKTEKRELEHSGEGDDGEILIDFTNVDT